MSAPRHLVTVWNPSHVTDAMDEHVRILLDWSARARAGSADPEDVYVWWARLRSPNRIQPLPHLNDVMRLQEQLDQSIETHVYITDYRRSTSVNLGHR